MKQASASKQVETGNYTTAYQKGFTLRSQGVEELATESNRAIIDAQTGQAVTAATAEYLITTLPKDSVLYTVFEVCYQIDSTIITPAADNLIAAYNQGNIAEVAAQAQASKDAVREVNMDLDNFQLLIIEKLKL